jgi:hypothetical protein
LIPSSDGSLLYFTSQGVRRSSVRTNTLIEKTPFTSDDGHFYSSRKDTKLLEIDIKTGEILHDYSQAGPRTRSVDDAESFIISRVDNVVIVVDIYSGLEEVFTYNNY